ncbi:hypothetical protein GGX14DRAFT_643658 [Mycena pura]|uniref:Uncharacterized protein n=1 Tax=Mycena pura TaxID=153505 RepID=A0AAD6VBD9_9AGAR|nr:hypothetical protein GGX14DRAFT_643658 [Mycena pura]
MSQNQILNSLFQAFLADSEQLQRGTVDFAALQQQSASSTGTVPSSAIAASSTPAPALPTPTPAPVLMPTPASELLLNLAQQHRLRLQCQISQQPTVVVVQLLQLTFLPLSLLLFIVEPIILKAGPNNLLPYHYSAPTFDQFSRQMQLLVASNKAIPKINQLYPQFTQWLHQNGLFYRYKLAETTLINDIARRITEDIAQSPMHWESHQPSSQLVGVLGSSVSLPLRLLGLSNRGSPRGDGLMMLRQETHDSSLTVADLVSNRKKYTGFVKSGVVFPAQNERGDIVPDWQPPQCESDEDESADEHNIETDLMKLNMHLLDSGCSTQYVYSCFVIQTGLQQSKPNSLLFATACPNLTAVTPFSFRITGELWAEEFVPEPERYQNIFDTGELTRNVFAKASIGSSNSILAIKGQSIQEVAANYLAFATQCAVQGDYTPILATDRAFLITRPDGTVLSTGSGVEREASFITFQHFAGNPGAWLCPQSDGQYSIATTTTPSFTTSEEHLVSSQVFGFFTSIMLLHGAAPAPIGPAVLQLLANNCDLRLLDRSFVREWHPELGDDLNNWIAIGPDGNISRYQSHFATFHDMELAPIQSRDPSQHRCLAYEMLYSALIGTQLPSHIEWLAFHAGLDMRCVNEFNFMEVGRFGLKMPWLTDFFSCRWFGHIQEGPQHSSILRDPEGSAALLAWSNPLARALLDGHFKIQRAKEEIKRLNIEIRRFVTYMWDEKVFLLKKEAELTVEDPDLAFFVRRYRNQRGRFDEIHMSRLRAMKMKLGTSFIGTLEPEVHITPAVSEEAQAREVVVEDGGADGADQTSECDEGSEDEWVDKDKWVESDESGDEDFGEDARGEELAEVMEGVALLSIDKDAVV